MPSKDALRTSFKITKLFKCNSTNSISWQGNESEIYLQFKVEPESLPVLSEKQITNINVAFVNTHMLLHTSFVVVIVLLQCIKKII